MTELSPAGRAVMDAFLKTPGEEPMPGWDYGRDLAAALRAAADQAVPEEPLNGGDVRWMFERDARQASRKKLLSIADELEGVKYGTYRCDLKDK